MRRRRARLVAIATVVTAMTACGNSERNGGAPEIDPPADAPAPGVDAAQLPEGACYTSADCETTKFCQWGPQVTCGADHGVGTCTPLGPPFCSDLGFWVCGCDGRTYTNECHSAGIGVAVDYGGPCREPGVIVACHTSADCPFEAEFPQYCVDDPTDQCDPAVAECPGVCVHGTYICGPTQPCLSQTLMGIQESPGTEVCMTVTPGSNDDPDRPGRCIYTTRATCKAARDCGPGELCLPELGCDPATSDCPSDCVRP